MTEMLARIRPFNKETGATCATYVFKGKMFLRKHGWYEVSEVLAKELRKLRVNDDNPRSPKIFDVCSAEQAAELDAEENAAPFTDEAPAVAPNPEPKPRAQHKKRGKMQGAVKTAPVATPELEALDFGGDDDALGPPDRSGDSTSE